MSIGHWIKHAAGDVGKIGDKIGHEFGSGLHDIEHGFKEAWRDLEKTIKLIAGIIRSLKKINSALDHPPGVKKGSHNIEHYPDWMWKNKGVIGNIPLKELVILGTHDSGTYGIDDRKPYSDDEGGQALKKKAAEIRTKMPDWVNRHIEPHTPPFLKKPLRHAVQDIVEGGEEMEKFIAASWSRAQDVSAYHQLKGGVRYLDLRVVDYSGDLWIAHGQISVRVSTLLEDVRKFSSEYPNEILILDFQSVDGLNDAQHTKLINLIQTLFKGQIADKDLRPSSEPVDFWTRKKTVVVIYENDRATKAGFWPRNEKYIKSPWQASDSIHDLEDVMVERAEELKLEHPGLFVSQGILVPDDKGAMIREGALMNEFGAPMSLSDLGNKTHKQWLEFMLAHGPAKASNIFIVNWFVGRGDLMRAVLLLNHYKALRTKIVWERESGTSAQRISYQARRETAIWVPMAGVITGQEDSSPETRTWRLEPPRKEISPGDSYTISYSDSQPETQVLYFDISVDGRHRCTVKAILGEIPSRTGNRTGNNTDGSVTQLRSDDGNVRINGNVVTLPLNFPPHLVFGK